MSCQLAVGSHQSAATNLQILLYYQETQETVDCPLLPMMNLQLSRDCQLIDC